jgi:hypothetical protein
MRVTSVVASTGVVKRVRVVSRRVVHGAEVDQIPLTW